MNKNLEFNRLFEKAEDLYDCKSYQIALDFINSALSIDTFISQQRLFETYLLRANIQIMMKKFAYGISDCREAIKIDPQSPRGFSLRGFALIKIGNEDDAIRDFDEAIRLDSHRSIDFYNRGVANILLSKYESSISDFNESIRLDPFNSDSFLCRGISKYYLDKNIESLRDFNIAIQYNSKDSSSFYWRGILKNKLEIYEDSIEDLTKAIKINPSDHKYFYQRGISYKSLGQYEAALRDFNASENFGYKYCLPTPNNSLKFKNQFSKIKILEGITIKFVNLIKKRIYRFKLSFNSEK